MIISMSKAKNLTPKSKLTKKKRLSLGLWPSGGAFSPLARIHLQVRIKKKRIQCSNRLSDVTKGQKICLKDKSFLFSLPTSSSRQRIIWNGPREMIHWTEISQGPRSFWVALPFLVAVFHLHNWVWVTATSGIPHTGSETRMWKTWLTQLSHSVYWRQSQGHISVQAEPRDVSKVVVIWPDTTPSALYIFTSDHPAW